MTAEGGRKKKEKTTHLGIKTPRRHFISRMPNGWVPRTYCRGSPLPRRRHSEATCCSAAAGDGQSAWACSRIQRSSLAAVATSRHTGRSVAAWWESWCARRKVEGGMRGIGAGCSCSVLFNSKDALLFASFSLVWTPFRYRSRSNPEALPLPALLKNRRREVRSRVHNLSLYLLLGNERKTVEKGDVEIVAHHRQNKLAGIPQQAKRSEEEKNPNPAKVLLQWAERRLTSLT